MDDSGSHACSQEVTLNTICIKLENIERDITEIKTFQTLFMNRMEAAALNSAKYPAPDFVNKVIAKVDRHETYFKIIVGVFVILIPFVLFIAERVWRG